MKYSLLTFAFLLFLLPVIAFAQQEYPNLLTIPGVTNASGFGGYINALYIFAISVAAILAVIKIIIGGVKYMLSDIVTNKSDAKNEIRGALIGLLLIISAVLIIEVINPNITSNDVGFKQIETSISTDLPPGIAFSNDGTGTQVNQTKNSTLGTNPSGNRTESIDSSTLSGAKGRTVDQQIAAFKSKCSAIGTYGAISQSGTIYTCTYPKKVTLYKEPTSGDCVNRRCDPGELKTLKDTALTNFQTQCSNDKGKVEEDTGYGILSPSYYCVVP